MHATTNEWWKTAVIYQIYSRSFFDNNGDGFGDLQGIINKLDYLADLGVDAIWLTPIYPSPDDDYGYDTTDHCAIDPRYGTMEDFDRLLKEAHTRGIRVIMDIVLAYTSDQHPWFIESRKSRDNPYHDYYLWRDPGRGGRVPNNWLSMFGGKAWEYVPELGQYYYHYFYKQQPDPNWRHPEVRRAQLEVFKFWLKRGVDGFRLDVFNLYFKDDQFRSNPPVTRENRFVGLEGIRPFAWQDHIYECDRPEMIPVLKEIRDIMDEYPGSYAVGETLMPTAKKAAGYCGPDRLHQAFNFKLLECPWNARRFLQAVLDFESALKDNWPNNVLGNHDRKRIAERYARGKDDARLKLIAAMLLTLRGTVFIYYGDEIGMRDVHLKRSELLDPLGIHYWPANVGRDGCRSPMQWDSSSNSGFSRSKPWLRVNKDYLVRNVAAHEKDGNSLLHFYRLLIRCRRQHPALLDGDFVPLSVSPKSVLAYLRRNRNETIMVILNFNRNNKRLQFEADSAGSKWEILVSTHGRSSTIEPHRALILNGDEALVLLKID
ncbi:MAG: alpha-amylase family glycosyl hydrolase [Dehalococcoidia bacterium]